MCVKFVVTVSLPVQKERKGKNTLRFKSVKPIHLSDGKEMIKLLLGFVDMFKLSFSL